MLFFRHVTPLRLTCGLDLRPHMQMALLILVLKYDFLFLFCFWTLMFRAVERREGIPPFHVRSASSHMSIGVVSACRYQQHSSVCVGVGGQSRPRAPAHPCVLLQLRAPAVHPCFWKRPMPVALSLGAAGARMWRQVPGSGGLTDGMPHRCFWKMP